MYKKPNVSIGVLHVVEACSHGVVVQFSKDAQV